jgi:hypothetical protein
MKRAVDPAHEMKSRPAAQTSWETSQAGWLLNVCRYIKGRRDAGGAHANQRLLRGTGEEGATRTPLWRPHSHDIENEVCWRTNPFTYGL